MGQSSRQPARLSKVCESQNYIIKTSSSPFILAFTSERVIPNKITTILFPRPDYGDTCHYLILDSSKLFYKKIYFSIEESKKFRKLKSIFSGHKKISLRVEKDQNTIRITKLWCFEKIRWKKKKKWGWNPNLTKIERIN